MDIVRPTSATKTPVYVLLIRGTIDEIQCNLNSTPNCQLPTSKPKAWALNFGSWKLTPVVLKNRFARRSRSGGYARRANPSGSAGAYLRNRERRRSDLLEDHAMP